MTVYSIYFSPTGGTKKINNQLTSAFEDVEEIDLSLYEERHKDRHFNQDDLCFIAVPSYGGRVPKTAADRIKHLFSKGTRAVIVVSYGNRDYDDTLVELYDLVKDQGFELVAGVAGIAEHSIMHQFASGRPDKDDIASLKDFSKEIKTRLNSPSKDLDLKGNRPYKELKSGSLKPMANDKCIKCGQCAKLCPVSAIPLDQPNKTHDDICISCMRCIEVCPTDARQLDSQKLQATVDKMKDLFKERKENELFI